MPIDIDDLKSWIQKSPKEVQTIQDIADRWKCSTETIRKEFWRKEKRALGDFIVDVKIEIAKKLLLGTNLLCKEICFEAGFRREDTGAEIFKQRVGVTMSQYRALHSGGASGGGGQMRLLRDGRIKVEVYWCRFK